jgi:hypothetical protein
MILTRLLMFSMLFVFLYSCATQRTYINTENKSDTDKKYANILFLHYGRDFENRKTIENEVTYWLRDKGYRVTPSIDVYENSILPSTEVIKRTIKAGMFDGLMVSRVRDIKEKDMHSDTQGRYTSYDPNAVTYYSWFDRQANMNTQGYSFQEKEFVVETRLFDAETEKVVYSIITKSYDSESFDFVVESFSKSIVKAMNRSKLLQQAEKN